jgi:hypothetical protein
VEACTRQVASVPDAEAAIRSEAAAGRVAAPDEVGPGAAGSAGLLMRVLLAAVTIDHRQAADATHLSTVLSRSGAEGSS